MRLGVSCLIHELGVTCGLAFSVGALDVRWICCYMRLGVSCLMHELGVTCGSAFSVGALDLRRIPVYHAARRLQFVTSSRLGVVCHWIYMRLGVAWASSVNGFRCGSASLGRCLSLNLDAARRRLGDGF